LELASDVGRRQSERRIENDCCHPIAIFKARWLCVQSYSRNVCKTHLVPLEDLALLFQKLLNSFQLRQTERCLQIAHPVLICDFRIEEVFVIYPTAPMIAKKLSSFENGRIIRD